jgi:hypothetical protein
MLHCQDCEPGGEHLSYLSSRHIVTEKSDSALQSSSPDCMRTRFRWSSVRSSRPTGPDSLTLPAELWLIIFDIVITTSITLLEHSNSISFPDVDEYLYDPTAHPPIDNSYGQLRLVCRTFNALLGGSPYHFMKSEEAPIPIATRSFYVPYGLARAGCFGQIIAQPLMCHQLVSMDTPCNFSVFEGRPPIFNLLRENSGSFPSIRCLTLRLVHHPWEHLSVPFWRTLNNTFPLLCRLFLTSNYQKDIGSALWRQDDGLVTFYALEILHLGYGLRYYSMLHFPRLRHVSLCNCSAFDLTRLALLPLLESALFRSLHGDPPIDLGLFPRLKLVGVPKWMIQAILPSGNNHPFEHLWLYTWVLADPWVELESIMQIPKRLPGISRVTLDLAGTTMERRTLLHSELQDADLRSSGLSMYPIPSGASHIVLKCGRRHPGMSGLSGSVKQRQTFSWIRGKLHR